MWKWPDFILMKKFDVLVVGELNVDIILNHIQGFPEIGKEILANDLNVTLGSSSAIFASNLSSLGTKVGFLGKIGEDNFADLVKKSLEDKKVDTQYITTSMDHKTGLTLVMNYGMDRANITYPGAMEHLYVNEITDDILKEAKHLHLSSVFLQIGLLKDITRLFQRAKAIGLTTSMDPQWDPSEKWDIDLGKLLPHIDVFLPNAEEFKHMINCTDIDSGIEKVRSFCNTIVIKNGERGAHLFNGKERITKPAFLNTDVVDCIGAGDSFDAGFIHAYLSGKTMEQSVEIGNITGAINTTASGGTAAFKDLESVAKVAKSKYSYDLGL